MTVPGTVYTLNLIIRKVEIPFLKCSELANNGKKYEPFSLPGRSLIKASYLSTLTATQS